MSAENIMYIEIDQNKEFHNFIRFLEREFKCDGLFNFAPPKEESPSITTEEIKEESDHIETYLEASQTTEAEKSGVSQKICPVRGGGEYGCGLCGKKFNQKKNLRRHEKLTHGELKYCCDQCDYKGAREREFRQHLREIYPDFALIQWWDHDVAGMRAALV